MLAIGNTIERLASVLSVLLAVLLIAMVSLSFVNVICRYFFGFSIQGADELQVFGLVWLTFLGAVLVTWRKQHLRMDVVLISLPKAVQRLARFAETLCFTMVGLFVVVHSFSYASRMFQLGYASDMAGVPTWIPHSAIVIGFALMIVVAIFGVAIERVRAAATQGAAPDSRPENGGTPR